MSTSLLKQAKKIMKDQYGEALTNKASDAFCLYASGVVSSRATARSFSLEESTTPTASSSKGIIMEFSKPEDEKLIRPEKAATRKKIASMLESLNDEEELKANLQQLVRQTRMKARREAAIESIQSINANLERDIEREFAHATSSLRNQNYINRICWLNQTVQTIANPNLLAEIASDPQIKKLDIPRQLEAEISETGKLVFAPQYRQKFSRKGKGIIVAVIDSEVALKHKAFGKRVLHRKNYTKEPWGNPHSHGTGVAGIIASADENFTGMAPEATIYNYKVLATNRSLNGDDFDGALAIQRALEDGAHIANCSWGAGPAGDGTSREARACDEAWELGMTIVKSAGNKGPGVSTLTSPADAKGVIVVGATGRDGKKIESYSSRGPLASAAHRPHLVAPGGSPGNGILSCLTGGGFDDIGNGTSFAAPHVAGMLALIIQGDLSLSPDEQRNLLLKLCKKLTGFTVDMQGKGFVSLASLLKKKN